MLRTAKWTYAFVISALFGELTAMGQTLPNLFPFPNAHGFLGYFPVQNRGRGVP